MDVMKKKETLTTVTVICDVCGKDCNYSDRPDQQYGVEFGELSASWGYLSSRDGVYSHCQMCEDCFDRVVEFVETIGGKVRHSEEGRREGIDYVVK